MLDLELSLSVLTSNFPILGLSLTPRYVSDLFLTIWDGEEADLVLELFDKPKAFAPESGLLSFPLCISFNVGTEGLLLVKIPCNLGKGLLLILLVPVLPICEELMLKTGEGPSSKTALDVKTGVLKD